MHARFLVSEFSRVYFRAEVNKRKDPNYNSLQRVSKSTCTHQPLNLCP